MVKWHAVDWVLRQLSYMKPIPDPPRILGEIHGIDKKGKDHINWANQYASYSFLWNARHERNMNSVSNTDLEPKYEASEKTSHTPIRILLCSRRYLVKTLSLNIRHTPDRLHTT
ncbi:hypothetical protein J1N35_041718 [Gossypium stocksii]|uniref:Uncharacterized protein n=1 Tax=Gossypium stocksii TaxID=47602 RepID=A0A9D3UG54_9ROSI|nr:hypothetical protein J1N35_041718 [Gossypium stocksii]